MLRVFVNSQLRTTMQYANDTCFSIRSSPWDEPTSFIYFPSLTDSDMYHRVKSLNEIKLILFWLHHCRVSGKHSQCPQPSTSVDDNDVAMCTIFVRCIECAWSFQICMYLPSASSTRIDIIAPLDSFPTFQIYIWVSSPIFFSPSSFLGTCSNFLSPP